MESKGSGGSTAGADSVPIHTTKSRTVGKPTEGSSSGPEIKADEAIIRKKSLLMKILGILIGKQLSDERERGIWNSRWEFVMSCIGFAIGMHNVWRFPRLVYQYGGGSFLVAYVITLVLLAFPVFFLELAVGQFTSQGPVNIFRLLMPAAEGLGWCTLAGQTVSSIYYSGVMSWAVFYMLASLTSPMPWATCGNAWNTDDCVSLLEWHGCQRTNGGDGNWRNDTLFYHRKCYTQENVTSIFKNVDSCMHDVAGLSESKQINLWKYNATCRVDLSFSFRNFDELADFYNLTLPEWINISSITDDSNRNATINIFSMIQSNSLKLQIIKLNYVNGVLTNLQSIKKGISLHLNLADKSNWETFKNYANHYQEYNLTKLIKIYCDFQMVHLSIFDCIKSALNQFDNMSTYDSEQFFNEVLDQKDSSFVNMKGVHWGLGMSLVLTWVIVSLSLLWGTKMLGKIVIFTAIFPLFMIIVFVIYTATLDGANDGYKFYLYADWSTMTSFAMWQAAGGQIFTSLSIGGGGLMTLSSYNKFRNNVLADSVIVAVFNCVTSFVAGFSIFAILGHMAKTIDKPIKDVIPTTSSSLAFIGYAHVTSSMPLSNLWAFLFFAMFVTLAIDSLFTMVETINTFVLDELPELRNYRKQTVCMISFLMMVLALPNVSRYGAAFVTIVDRAIVDYVLFLVAVCELVLIAYVYGAKNIALDFSMMLGKKDGTPSRWFNSCAQWYFIVMWLLSPVCVTALMVNTWYLYIYEGGLGSYLEISPEKMHPLVYVLFCLIALGMFLVIVPGYFIYNKCTNYYTVREMFRTLPLWGPALDVDRTGRYAPLKNAGNMKRKQLKIWSDEVSTILEIAGKN